ncbi:MAG: alpha/beta fold hydrolase, partial [Prevotellaceae bacterium]|jgi:pimeloyl-ACP methyl ester carboxylesterase|nr:alpha/beta fold hydrolase [Prevotellaceae bacterium]
MQLFFREFGNAGEDIIIAHGLYGCSDNWVSVAKILAQTNHVFAVDLRNHGRSPHSNEHSYSAMCNDLAEFIESKNIKKPIVAGHSMGGRCAALLAKQYPDLLAKIIIVDISPFDCENQKTISAFHKNILTTLKFLNLNEIHSRQDAAKKISKKINDTNLQNFLLKNLYRTSNGSFFWRFNLLSILNNVNNIVCGSLKQSENYKIKIPTLLITGKKSDYVVNSDIEIITNKFSDIKIQIIEDAGHWVHAEKTQIFIDCVKRFINTQQQ